MPVSHFIAALAGLVVAGAPAPLTRPAPEAGTILAFINAWDAADAAGLARLFEPGGRLVIPSGVESSGRGAIQTFYSAVFESGYRGSKGGAKIMRVTKLTNTLSLVEGEWRIDYAKQADGSPRRPESGQFSAIVRASSNGWRLVVLREMKLVN